MKIDFSKLNQVHFTGIKGVGMTALALCLQDMGINISGSDVKEKFVTDELLFKRKIKWNVGFSNTNLKPKPDLLITTAAHGGLANIEVEYAKKSGIPVITYAEMLAEVSYAKETIAVCGVGGKTTTASMLTVLMDSAGFEPSFIVGVGNIYPLGISGRYKKDKELFICEADDYVVSPGIDNRPKFSLLSPKVIVVTNIEYDHPDIFKNIDDTKNIFKDFFIKVPKYGVLVANSENKNVIEVINNLKIPKLTYGFDNFSDYQISKVVVDNQKTYFDIKIKKTGKIINKLFINVPGKLNVLNATATLIVGDFYHISEDKIREGLMRYLGCRRRFEEMPHYNGAIFIDDYAHHPTEINLTLDAAKSWFPGRRIIALFQPHTYSRTKALFNEFVKAFTKADIVGFMDIYSSARELKDDTISSEILSKATKKFNKHTFYLGDHNKTINWIKNNVKSDDLVLTLGAGDIFHLYDKLKAMSVRI